MNPGGRRGGKTTAPISKAVSSATLKKALVRRVSNDALSGKRISPQMKRYVQSQQQESLRLEKGGKGSKAARRLAAMRG